MGESLVWLFSGFRNSVLVPAFISNVPDDRRQSARYPVTSLENSLRITAKATPWSCAAFTKLDRQLLPPTLHGLADFASATFELRKTSV